MSDNTDTSARARSGMDDIVRRLTTDTPAIITDHGSVWGSVRTALEKEAAAEIMSLRAKLEEAKESFDLLVSTGAGLIKDLEAVDRGLLAFADDEGVGGWGSMYARERLQSIYRTEIEAARKRKRDRENREVYESFTNPDPAELKEALSNEAAARHSASGDAKEM